MDVPVRDLVEDIRETINLREGLTVEAVGEMPTLHTQRPPLQQVLQNLIENAAKHHDKPEGRIEVRCVPNGKFCEFSVRDDGPGISDKYHGKVFQMFQTLKTRDTLDSTGIGLATRWTS